MHSLGCKCCSKRFSCNNRKHYFSAPSNAVEGAFICVEINYNGSHTIAFNTVFEFAASTAPTTTDTDGKTDILVFRYNGAVWQEVGEH